MKTKDAISIVMGWTQKEIEEKEKDCEKLIKTQKSIMKKMDKYLEYCDEYEKLCAITATTHLMIRTYLSEEGIDFVINSIRENNKILGEKEHLIKKLMEDDEKKKNRVSAR